jgi:hypothetical protein
MAKNEMENWMTPSAAGAKPFHSFAMTHKAIHPANALMNWETINRNVFLAIISNV